MDKELLMRNEQAQVTLSLNLRQEGAHKGVNYNNGEAFLVKNGNPGYESVLLGQSQPERSVAAHELGHNLGLQHTFSSNNDAPSFLINHRDRQLIPQNTTKNIMDYSMTTDRTDFQRYFFKYQIEFLKNK
jgi:hypothetical protein